MTLHEDIYHIFFHCKTTIDVWSAANVWHLIALSLNHFDNTPNIIFNLLQKLSAAQVEIIVTIIWSIWKARNLKLWQHVSFSSIKILERAKHLLEGWKIANRKQGVSDKIHTSSTLGLHHQADQNSNNMNNDIRWRKPKSGRLKCNVDASFSNSSNKVGIGMCIQDSAGNHLRSKTMWFTPLCSVDVGEALELYMQFGGHPWTSTQKCWFWDWFENSSYYFNKGMRDITEFGSIMLMDDIIQFCNLHLTNSYLEFIRRQTNEVSRVFLI